MQVMKEPRLLDFRGIPLSTEAMEEVAGHLRQGGFVAAPTETVYGFGCTPSEPALGDLLRLKGRGTDKPFLLLIPGADAVGELTWTESAMTLARAFWPGALTLILRDPAGIFPPGVRSPEGGVAVRVSPHPLAMALVEALGGPIVSTSANLPGGPPALSAEGALQVARELEMGGRIWILDGGHLEPSEPSTLVDCMGPEPAVLRVGAISPGELRRVVSEIHGII